MNLACVFPPVRHPVGVAAVRCVWRQVSPSSASVCPISVFTCVRSPANCSLGGWMLQLTSGRYQLSTLQFTQLDSLANGCTDVNWRHVRFCTIHKILTVFIILSRYAWCHRGSATHLDLDAAGVIEGHPGQVVEGVGRSEVIVPLHRPVPTGHDLARLDMMTMKVTKQRWDQFTRIFIYHFYPIHLPAFLPSLTLSHLTILLFYSYFLHLLFRYFMLHVLLRV